MKSTFHHTLITLAVVDILFVIVLIIDTQVLVLIIDTQVERFFLLIFCFETRTRILTSSLVLRDERDHHLDQNHNITCAGGTEKSPGETAYG